MGTEKVEIKPTKRGKRKVGLGLFKTRENETTLSDFRFRNGEKVRDMVTGFVGTVTSRTEYLNGCIRYGVQGVVDKKDPQKVPEVYMFDEAQLELVPEKKNSEKVKEKVEPARTGGPRDFYARDIYEYKFK